MSSYEIATGFVLGGRDFDGVGGAGGSASPLAAFESVILAALQRPPCVVLFSGGRDSSAVLAVAAGLARRHGLALPVAQTIRFSSGGETDEDAWQEMVIQHLGLSDWVRVEAGDEADLLGPSARGVLLRHGVIWSPILSTRDGYLAGAAGGSVLTGEGGDEILGPRRPGPLAALAAGRRLRPLPSMTRAAGAALLPARVRAARLRRSLGAALGLEWLQPDVRDDFLARSGLLWADEPLGWAESVAWVASRRHVRLAVANMAGLAADHDVVLRAPFLDQSFVAALGAVFPRLGPASRGAAMQVLFAGVLPEAVLTRTSKAVFTLPAWGPRTREFVAGWDGQGLDRGLVDVDALARHWAGDRPSAMTFAMVQAAWLATRPTLRT